MREIKFRCWNIKESHWQPFQEWSEAEANAYGTSMGAYELQNDEYFAWSQYTGLKDKNGKEIYEGDVVVCDNRRCKVVWEQSDCSYKYEPEFQDAREEGGRRLYVMPYNGDEYVIGNIYENPELLEAK